MSPVNGTHVQDAFQQHVAAHMGIVRKIASTYGQTAHDRADLVQDILAALWEAWPRYDSQRPFSTWMYRVALNIGITQHRRDRYRRHAPLADEQDHLVGAGDVDIEERQQLSLVGRAMQALSSTDRALLLLYLEGHNHRQIADVLGTTEGNVAVRFNRIKAQLRKTAVKPCV